MLFVPSWREVVSHLVQLKQQIKSIQTTKKITHAIRLVSMSLYSKLEKQNTPLKYYQRKVQKNFMQLIEALPSWKDSVLFPQDIQDLSPLIVIIATSKGLCGSLNSNMFRYIKQSLFLEPNQRPQIIAIGQKAIKYAKEQTFGELVCTYGELSSSHFIAIADDLMEKIFCATSPYSSVTFFSNEFCSFFLQKPKKNSLIPVMVEKSLSSQVVHSDNLSHAEQDNDLLLSEGDFIWEQPGDQIAHYFAKMYIRSSIMNILLQALISEHAARFIAMDNSFANAEKILDKLVLQFNKMRQTLITREVAELTANLPNR
jgi:F-type H+-transporting ATPase subunit gamma